MRNLRRLFAGCVASVLALAMLAVPAQASSVTYARPDTGRATSLEIRYHQGSIGFEGVEFKAYKVADMADTVEFAFTDRFAGYPVEFKSAMAASDWASMAEALAGYVSRDALEPDYAGTTDKDGRWSADGLDASLWLVMGGSHQREYRATENGESVLHKIYYHAAPFLVATPNLADGEWYYDVSVSPKFTASESESIDRRVLKVWNDAGYESQRPGALTFDLVRDGEVYDTVELTAADSWRYQWDGLDNSHQWRIVEHAAGNYTVSARQEGITYVVTNTYNRPYSPPPRPSDPDDPVTPVPPADIPDEDPPLSGEPELPEDPDVPETPHDPGDPPDTDIPDPDVPLSDKPLPQTGQLWWPVPVLAFAGLLLFSGGWLVKRRSGRE